MAAKRSKTGDGFPLDVTGAFLFEGAIVAFAATVTYMDDRAEIQPDLRLGFIRKLGKSYADVAIPSLLDVKDDVFRLKEPQKQLVVVDPDRLNSRVAIFEKLKMEAAKVRTSY